MQMLLTFDQNQFIDESTVNNIMKRREEEIINRRCSV